MKTFPEPRWLSEIVDQEAREMARRSFIVRLAALYHSEAGNLRQLSAALNQPETKFHQLRRKNCLTAEDCVMIEKLVGVDLFPRALLRPDIFE